MQLFGPTDMKDNAIIISYFQQKFLMKISGAEEEKGSLNICIYMLEGIVNYWYLSLLLARVLLSLLWPGYCCGNIDTCTNWNGPGWDGSRHSDHKLWSNEYYFFLTE